MSEYQNPTERITAAHQNLRDALSTYLDLITPAVLSGLGPQGALDATREFETLRNQMAIADHAHITALQDTHAAAVCARPSTATLLALTLRITPAQARARVRAAHALTPRVALTGAALPALRPVLAKKQATGTVTPAQAGRVLHHLHEFDANPRISTEQVEQAEHMLTELTDTLGPNELDTAADRIADVLDPDGDPPSDEETQRRRALTISPNGQITGQLTPAAGAKLHALLDPLAAPRDRPVRARPPHALPAAARRARGDLQPAPGRRQHHRQSRHPRHRHRHHDHRRADERVRVRHQHHRPAHHSPRPAARGRGPETHSRDPRPQRRTPVPRPRPAPRLRRPIPRPHRPRRRMFPSPAATGPPSGATRTTSPNGSTAAPPT